MKDKKEEITPQLLETEEQKQSKDWLSNLLNTPYQQYTGQMFGSYPYQSQLKENLGQYVGRDMPELYGAAQSELMKTLTGGYDPYTSDYYKSAREGALREEQSAVNRLRRGAQLGGMMYSTPRIEAEGKTVAQTQNNLANILGQLSLQERQNRLNAVPTAMSTGQQISNMPIENMQAIMSVSPVLKALEEEPLQYAQQQFMNEQLFPYQYQLPVAQSLLNYAPWYYPQYGQTGGGYGQLGSGVGSLLGGLVGSIFPGIGTMAGAGIGGSLGGGLASML